MRCRPLRLCGATVCGIGRPCRWRRSGTQLARSPPDAWTKRCPRPVFRRPGRPRPPLPLPGHGCFSVPVRGRERYRSVTRGDRRHHPRKGPCPTPPSLPHRLAPVRLHLGHPRRRFGLPPPGPLLTPPRLLHHDGRVGLRRIETAVAFFPSQSSAPTSAEDQAKSSGSASMTTSPQRCPFQTPALRMVPTSRKPALV